MPCFVCIYCPIALEPPKYRIASRGGFSPIFLVFREWWDHELFQERPETEKCNYKYLILRITFIICLHVAHIVFGGFEQLPPTSPRHCYYHSLTNSLLINQLLLINSGLDRVISLGGGKIASDFFPEISLTPPRCGFYCRFGLFSYTNFFTIGGATVPPCPPWLRYCSLTSCCSLTNC